MIKKEKTNNIISKCGILIILFTWFLYGCYYLYSNNTITDDSQIIDKIIDVNDNQEIVIDKEVINQTDDEVTTTNKQNETYNYIGVLEIPKINVKKGFLNINDENNNVSKNIQVLNNSTMPDEENSVLAIASHAGNGWNAFFKNLYKLELDDDVYIYYNNVKYSYKVINIYNDEKDGTISISKSNVNSLLVLTTCNLTDRTKQRVVIAKMIK